MYNLSFDKDKKLIPSKNFYRIRAGNYRVIYMVLNDQLIILVVKIGHRREIYQKL